MHGAQQNNDHYAKFLDIILKYSGLTNLGSDQQVVDIKHKYGSSSIKKSRSNKLESKLGCNKDV